VEPTNFLDEIVARFRERWETDPQYRAMMSGVIGLATLFGLCSCMVVASLAANSTLGSLGFGGGGSGAVAQQQGAGGGGVVGVPTFPTDAVPTWQEQSTPGSIVAPTSGTNAPTPTPIPTPTSPPTATPCVSNCGGGGGGGGVTVTVTGYTPSSWRAGCTAAAPCHVTVNTSVPNDGVLLNITGCNGTAYPAIAQGTTDGSGNLTLTVTGVGGGSAQSAVIWPIAQNDNKENKGYPACT
jgi:hypothetical protein